MQLLQPTQRLDSTKTIPSFSRFCIAPVGQALTHHGSSQWKQGMKTKRMPGQSVDLDRTEGDDLARIRAGAQVLVRLAVDLAGEAADAARLVVAQLVPAHRPAPSGVRRFTCTTVSVSAQPPPAGSKS